jgi:hypothetical protein
MRSKMVGPRMTRGQHFVPAGRSAFFKQPLPWRVLDRKSESSRQGCQPFRRVKGNQGFPRPFDYGTGSAMAVMAVRIAAAVD